MGKQDINQGQILDLGSLFVDAPVGNTLSLYLTLSSSLVLYKLLPINKFTKKKLYIIQGKQIVADKNLN
jgi:hypothetical protein